MVYHFFSYLCNMDGIDYELQQNELLGEIEKDVSTLLKNEEEKVSSNGPTDNTKTFSKTFSKTDLELELAFAFSPKPE